MPNQKRSKATKEVIAGDPIPPPTLRLPARFLLILGLLGGLGSEQLLPDLKLLLSLETHDTTTPSTVPLLIEFLLESLLKVLQRTL